MATLDAASPLLSQQRLMAADALRPPLPRQVRPLSGQKQTLRPRSRPGSGRLAIPLYASNSRSTPLRPANEGLRRSQRRTSSSSLSLVPPESPRSLGSDGGTSEGASLASSVVSSPRDSVTNGSGGVWAMRKETKKKRPRLCKDTTEAMSDVAEKLSSSVVMDGDDSGDEASEEEEAVVQVMSLKEMRKEIKRKPPLLRFFLEGERDTIKRPGGTQQLYFRVVGPSSRAVRHAFRRVGFIQTQGDCWNGLWGRLGNVTDYKTLDCYQKVNHFPGTHELGRKDCLHKNISKLRRRIGSTPLDENDILPKCFILPADGAELAQEMAANPHNIYVIKPPASSRGRGIRLATSIGDIPTEKKSLVQRYVSNPFLIDGYKFDLRIYVLVTSFDPLRVYIYTDGLGRFCTEKYKKGDRHTSKRYMHLTNYSLQKNRANFVANKDAEKDDEGSKWSLKAVLRKLTEMSVDTSIVVERIKDLVIRTIISVEPKVTAMMQAHVAYPQNCYECFGFDVLLDENLRPWLVEVNTSPSLSSDSPLDKKIKTKLVTELFNVVGFRQYDRKTYKKDMEDRRQARLLGLDRAPPRTPMMNPPGTPQSTDLKNKKRDCLLKGQSPLENLNPEDLEMIVEAEAENSRSNEWQRIFPSPRSNLYDRLFEFSRYSNMLLYEWVSGKGSMRTRQAINEYVSRRLKEDYSFN